MRFSHIGAYYAVMLTSWIPTSFSIILKMISGVGTVIYSVTVLLG